MRLSKPRIDALSQRLAANLLNKKLIECDRKMDGLSAMISAVINKDMAIEDALDREVEALMKKYAREMRGEQLVRRKLGSYKRKIVEGRLDWEIPYDKTYQEELQKRGL